MIAFERATAGRLANVSTVARSAKVDWNITMMLISSNLVDTARSMPPGISGPPRPCTVSSPARAGLFFFLAREGCLLPYEPDLTRLIRLQQLETTADDARRRIADHPARTQALDARLQSARELLAGIKTRLAAASDRRRAEEKEVAAVQARLAKYKDQLLEVKTNREYTAMLHEIETAQNDIRTREDRILEIMMESDELNAAIKKAEAELKTAEKEIAAERAALDDRDRRPAGGDRQDDRRAQDSSSRKSTAACCAIFETTAKGRKGVAVAEAKNGLCTICHVRLRPQVFNEIRRNESIIQCDSCRRILYFAGNTEAPAPVSQVLMAIVAYIDGGARGNPGPAGYGVRIEDEHGALINEFNGFLGTSTNNVAEYNGLLAALKYAQEHGHRAVRIKSDSELLVKADARRVRVKNAGSAAAVSAGAHDCARGSTASCTSTSGASRTRMPTGWRTWRWTKAPGSGIRD